MLKTVAVPSTSQRIRETVAPVSIKASTDRPRTCTGMTIKGSGLRRDSDMSNEFSASLISMTGLSTSDGMLLSELVSSW